MKLVRGLFFLSLFLASCIPGKAQDDTSAYITLHRLLSVEDGLASREVFCGLQDSKGFVWLGTRNGLNRFDGKNFLLFTQKDGLQGKKILQLVRDGAENIWVVYGKETSSMDRARKVDILNPVTMEVKSLTRFFNQLPFKESDVDFIIPDEKAGILIITTDRKAWHFSNTLHFDKWVDAPAEDSVFWYGAGLYHHNSCVMFVPENQLLNITPGSVSQITSQLPLLPLIFDQSGQCIVLRQQKKQRTALSVLRNNKLEDIVPAPFPFDGPIENMYTLYDPETNSAVVHTVEGVFLFEQNGPQLIMDKQMLKQHPDMMVRGYFCDKTGKCWLCTSIGVFIIKIERNKFTHYFTTGQLPLTFSNQARGIYADISGNVYANIWNNFCFSQAGKPGEEQKIAVGGLLYALLPYNNEILYPLGYRVWEYDEHSNAVKTYGPPIEIWGAYILEDKKILLSDLNGFILFDPVTRQFTGTGCHNDSFPTPTHIYRFFTGKDRRLWAAGENGLFILNKEGRVIDYYGDKALNQEHKLPFNGLNDAYEDSSGIFWLATSGEGLLEWNRNKNSLRHFSVSEGFSSNIMYRIEADNLHHLWISTDYGLARFNTSNHSVYTYTVKDGISHNEFNRISSFKAPDGRMYFGGLNGINAFYPSDFTNDTGVLHAPLRITSFTQFDAKLDKLVDKTIALVQNNEIELSPGDRFFNLEFNLLDYENEPHTYAYKIEGLDKTWNHISENSIRISGLPYGNFTLRVKGQNINGQSGNEEIKIGITVVRPFYLRDWFFVLAGLTASVLVYVFVYFRTRQLERDNIRLENTVASRTKELRTSLGEKEVLLKEIHHRVKNNLQTITSLLDLQGRTIDDDNARNAIKEGQNRVHSIALIHQNLYQNETQGSIEFSSFMNELANSIKNIFLKKGYEFQFVNQIPETHLDIDTAIPLGLIANELLTNGFKYGYDPENLLQITVTLASLNSGAFIFELRDNGPGLPPGFDIEKAKSLGLRLVSRLSAQLDGEVTYHYDKGSVFEISFKDTEARKSED